MMPASCSASRTSTARSFGSRGRRRCSTPRKARATGVSTPSRRLPDSCHRAPREASCGIGAEPSYEDAEITAAELKAEWDRNPDLLVIDVREPHEYEIAHIDGSVLIPLGELPDRLSELDGHREVVTHGHHGARSLKALEILKAAGFSKVR